MYWITQNASQRQQLEGQSLWSVRDVGFEAKVVQIGTKWDKSGLQYVLILLSKKLIIFSFFEQIFFTEVFANKKICSTS